MEGFVAIVRLDRGNDQLLAHLSEAGLGVAQVEGTRVETFSDDSLAISVRRRDKASDVSFGPVDRHLQLYVQGCVEPLEAPRLSGEFCRLAPDKVLPVDVLADPALAAGLTGSFQIVGYTADTQQLVAVVDRLASRPIYCYRDSRCLILSSDIGAILRVPGVECSLDTESLVQFLRTQMLFGNRTLYTQIQKLMPGTVLRCDLTVPAVEIEGYWSMKPKEPFEDTESAIVNLATALVSAGERIARGSRGAGIFLSGGIDSRVTLAVIRPHLESLQAFTFGPALTDEGLTARSVARYVGADWHLVVQDARDYWECLSFYLPALQASYSMAHAHVAKAARLMQKLDIDTVYDGWGLDLPLSGSYLPKERITVGGRTIYTYRLACIRTSEDARKWVERSIDIEQGSFSNSFLSSRLRDVWETASMGAVGRSIDRISSAWHKPSDQIDQCFASDLSAFRSYPVTSIGRLLARQRNLLFDSEIIDCYLRLSTRQRFLGPIYRRAFERIDPTLARFRYSNTGTSPFAPRVVQALVLQARQFGRANRERVQRLLSSVGLGNLMQRHLYGSYASPSELAQALVSSDVPDAMATRRALMEGPLAQCGILDVQRLRGCFERGRLDDEHQSLALLALASLAAWLDRYPARIER